MYSLCGNASGFLHEFEISLKSALLNAPLDAPLQVHVLADGKAFDGLNPILYHKANLTSWKTRNPISIHLYNLQAVIASWEKRLELFLKLEHGKKKLDLERHTIGAFFDLLAHEVLPSQVRHFISADTDVIFLANLQNVWQYTYIKQQNDCYYWWGEDECSGFVVMNAQTMKHFWELARTMKISDPYPRDQALLRSFSQAYNYSCRLPTSWDVSARGLSNLFSKAAKGDTLLDYRPDGVAFLHFNIGGASTTAFWNETKSDKIKKFLRAKYFFVDPKTSETTWKQALYHIRMPWPMARFLAQSQIPTKAPMINGCTVNQQQTQPGAGGYALQVHHHVLQAPEPARPPLGYDS